MTDVTRYKNICVDKETYEVITQIAQYKFDIPISRSKALKYLAYLFMSVPIDYRLNLMKNHSVRTPKPKQSNEVVDSDNHLNSYRYYAENKR